MSLSSFVLVWLHEIDILVVCVCVVCTFSILRGFSSVRGSDIYSTATEKVMKEMCR